MTRLHESQPSIAAETEESPALLDRMLAEQPQRADQEPVLRATGKTESLVGEVVDARHPTLRGRVRVRWRDLEGLTFERWVPALQGLPVRAADHVLMTRASNWPEFVVTGVLDGFAERPEVDRETKAAVELERDEALRVRSSDGQELLEVFQTEAGPVVRLLQADVNLELAGRLKVKAQSIELEATKGEARITATDDVVVHGETVHLN